MFDTQLFDSATKTRHGMLVAAMYGAAMAEGVDLRRARAVVRQEVRLRDLRECLRVTLREVEEEGLPDGEVDRNLYLLGFYSRAAWGARCCGVFGARALRRLTDEVERRLAAWATTASLWELEEATFYARTTFSEDAPAIRGWRCVLIAEKAARKLLSRLPKE